MPSFNIVKETTPSNSFRVSGVMNAFDIQSNTIKENFNGNINIEDKDWNIGLIVGSSGTGKTTIARELFDDSYFINYEYKADNVLDDMPKEKTLNEIMQMFGSVGFNTPKSWLKPFNVLSQGEQMRVNLARSLLEQNDLIVFDEFTSTVDRNVAKVGCHAIQKTIRRENDKKFIGVSCHSDIIEWLSPDWIYDTNVGDFSFLNRGNDLNAPRLNSNYMNWTKQLKQKHGTYLKSIII